MLRKARQIGLVEDLVQQFQESILSGKYPPGHKFPPTREMEKSLGASRGSLREALRILEQKGLVEIKVGSKGGVFVREASAQTVSEGLSLLIQQLKVPVEELADFRVMVEAGLVERVVKVASDEELDKLQEYIPRMKACAVKGGTEGWVELLAIEVGLRKDIISLAKSLMYEAVLLPIHENIFNYTDYYLPGQDGLAQEAFEDWRVIIEALGNRDAETAALRTQDHIRRFAVRLEQGRLKSADEHTGT